MQEKEKNIVITIKVYFLGISKQCKNGTKSKQTTNYKNIKTIVLQKTG